MKFKGTEWELFNEKWEGNKLVLKTERGGTITVDIDLCQELQGQLLTQLLSNEPDVTPAEISAAEKDRAEKEKADAERKQKEKDWDPFLDDVDLP